MTEDEAVHIADKYILHEMGATPTFAGRSCRYELRGATLYKSDSWTVLYKTILLEEPDGVVDDDLMVIVDIASGKAHFFGEETK